MRISREVILFSLTLMFIPQFASAFDQGDIIIRGGSATVSPNDSSSNVSVGGADLGFDVNVQKETQLGLTIAYFLNEKLSLELLLSTPFKHEIDFGASDPLGTGDRLGEITHLPPTLSLNYYLNSDSSSKFQPYLGAGINYMIFFDEDFSSANRNIGLDNLDLENTFGLALQAGVDYIINDRFFVNSAVRWVDINTVADFDLNGIDGDVERVEIDPWIFTFSVGYKF